MASEGNDQQQVVYASLVCHWMVFSSNRMTQGQECTCMGECSISRGDDDRFQSLSRQAHTSRVVDSWISLLLSINGRL